MAADYGTLSFTNGVTLDAATGMLTVPAGVSSFEVIAPTVNDTRSEATESLILNIDGLFAVGSITDNDFPVIVNPAAANGAAAATIRMPENNMPVTVLSTLEPATLAITGGTDAGLFTLSDTGRLSFKTAPDFEGPTDTNRGNDYQLQITATDVNGNVSVQTVTVFITDVVEAVPMYAARTAEGDRLLSTNQALTQSRAAATGSTVDVDFYVMPSQIPGTVPLKAWVNAITGDLFYAPEGTKMPYACYFPADSSQLGFVRPVGAGDIAVNLYMNPQGITQMATAALAAKLGLTGQGYVNLGPIFSSIDPTIIPTAGQPTVEVGLVGLPQDMGL